MSDTSPDVAIGYDAPRRFLPRMPDWDHVKERLGARIVAFGLSLVPENNLIRHARDELKRAGLFDTDSDYGGDLGRATLALTKMFSLEGHSGYSASMSISLAEKVLRFKPLTPLTGEDDEWTEYMNGHFQNKRCSHVFKDSKDGIAYDSNGRVFREPDGGCYTNGNSRVPVTFPYVPKTEYVEAAQPPLEDAPDGKAE